MGIEAFLDMKKLKEAKPSGGNFNYPKAGFQGLVQVESVKFDRTFVQGAASGTPYFAMACKVMSTNMPEERALQVGQVIDYYVPGDQGFFLGNIQAVICAILGVDKADVDAMDDAKYNAVVKELLDGARPAAIGNYLWCRCVGGITKTGPRQGQPNAVQHYSHPTPEQYQSAGLAPPA